MKKNLLYIVATIAALTSCQKETSELAQNDEKMPIQLSLSLQTKVTDAGYENGNTELILDALKESDVKAAFFLVGNYLETSPEIVKRMVAEGVLVFGGRFHFGI